MALTTDEKAYVKRLRQAGADDENVLYYLKQRRGKETLQNQPKQQGVFSKIAQAPVAFGQGLVTGTIRGVGNVAKFGGNVIDKALPGDYLKRGTEALQRGTEGLAGGIEGINQDLTQNVGQNVGQFASNFIGGSGLVKGGAKLATRAGGLLGATKTGANLLGRTAPITSQLGKIGQFAKGSTLGAKATNLGLKAGKWGAIGGVETAGYDIASKGEISPSNVAIGSVFSAMLPVAGIGLKKLAGYTTGKLPQTLQLQGLMNPAKVTMLKGKLMTEGVATPQDLGKWMLDRGIKGDKETIINTLLSRADDSKQAVDDSLASIRGVISSPTAKNALQQTYDDLAKIAGLEDEAGSVLNMLNKDKYTLTELNKVKRILDDQYNLYTKTGDPTAGMKAKGLQNIRSTLRKTIEDEAEALGVTNIKALNNETQIARGMADAISRKDSADAVREALTAFAPSGIGGIAGGFAGPFDKSTPQGFVGNVLLGVLAGKALGSTTLKTNIASLLNKLSKQEIGALDAYLRSGGKTALTPKIIQTMDDTLKLLPPASGKPVSASVVDVKPMTGFSPGRMQAQQQAIGSKVGTQPLTTATQQNPGVSGVTPLSSTQGVQQKILPKVPGEKVIPPIIPKSQPKAKLRTNEDALKKASSILPGNNTRTLYELANENPAKLKRMIMADGKIGSMQADDFIERAKLGKVRDDVAGNILKPESKLPKTPQEGKTQNFTQFAKEKGLASDYDITDHSALSPSGHVSKTTKTRSEERTLARIKENEQAHKLYEDEIKKGNIVDPSNNVTKERLLSAETKKIVDDLEKQINAINSNIKFVESLGRKPNGDLKIGIKRTRDDYLARRKVLQDKLDEVKPKSSLPPPQEGKTVEKLVGTKYDFSNGIGTEMKTVSEVVENSDGTLTLKSRLGSKNNAVKELNRAETEKLLKKEGIPVKVDAQYIKEQIGNKGIAEIEKDGVESYIKNNKNILDAEIESQLREFYKKKSLPLSQKSEVKYSKPDLASEAKKYKSADDFVKAQGEPVYHGTDRVFDKFDLSKLPENEQGLYGRGIYVSPNKDFTAKYGKNNIEIIIDKKANLFDWDAKLPATNISQLKNTLKDVLNVDSDTINHIFSIPGKPINLYKRIQDILEISPKKASDIFSESGIHGITVSKNGKLHEISIFDDTKIKTKQQLLDIYNKANKK